MSERQLEIPPERVVAWVDGFRRRHGAVTAAADRDTLRLEAADGSAAELWQPWGKVPEADDPVAAFAEHALRTRRLGVLLVRRKRHAVAIVEGTHVVAARLDNHYIQGRTKAGGWSQHRFERRRTNQARKAFEDAAEDAAALLLPELRTLEGLVTAGDRAGVATVLADPHCRALNELVARMPHERAYGIPDPNRTVLEEFPAKFRAVRVRLREAEAEPES